MEAGTLTPTRAAPALGRLLRFATLAVTIAAVLAWLVFLRPAALGGPAAYVIVSGASMEPGLRTGDVVVALRADRYEVGDVVVYRVPAGEHGAGTTVIHRIVGGSARSGFVLRGDNKDGIDPWRPTTDDVLGSARLSVPRVGEGLVRLRSPVGLALLAGLTTFLVALWPAGRRVRQS